MLTVMDPVLETARGEGRRRRSQAEEKTEVMRNVTDDNAACGREDGQSRQTCAFPGKKKKKPKPDQL